MEIKFTPLIEKASSSDIFKHKTHERIAETIHGLLVNNKGNAQTVGLEGGWGAGKSTVVSLLKNKLPEKDFEYFYFDAWAHEGDPLRRIFLESLIKSLKFESPELSDLKERISNRKRDIKTTTQRGITLLGTALSISLFFVPLGAAIISTIDFSTIGLFVKDAPLNEELVLGSIFTLAPLLVLLVYLICLVCSKKKKVKDLKNWAFLENNSNSEVTQEVSEEEERSSIEFEKYFEQIVKLALNSENDKQLIIVIDNLDRVDAQDSLKIWSTLQTFLKQRNPTSNNSSDLNNIWIIVPYDVAGLSKLWNNNGEQECADNFFDKCFQMRLEVPKPVLTDWEDFISQMIDNAFGESLKQKTEIIDVFRLTRKNISDIPTPREIKTFINQLGVLLLNSNGEVPVRSVSYYTVLRYIDKLQVQQIQKSLLESKIPSENHFSFLPESIIKDIAGLSFGVPSDDGQQLLLEPEIEKNLQNHKTDKLKRLVANHKGGFWFVFNYHIERLNVDRLFSYSLPVHKELWSDDKNQCTSFITGLRNSEIKFQDKINLDNHVSFISMFNDSNQSLKKYWQSIVTFINSSFNESITNEKELVELISKIMELVPYNDLTAVNIKSLNLENWQKWALESTKNGQPIYDWIKPEEKWSQELTAKIVPGKAFEKEILGTTQYFYLANKHNWSEIIEACTQHIFWNNGTPSGNKHSFDALKIILVLADDDFDHNVNIETLLSHGAFHNFIFHQKNKGSVLLAAALTGRFWEVELQNKKINAVGDSQSGLKLIKDFWLTRNNENAVSIYNILKNSVDVIWKLANDSRNKLVAEIINNELNDKESSLFKIVNALHRLENSIVICEDIEDFDNNKLAERFVTFSKLKIEIKDLTTEDIHQYSQALSYCIKYLDDISSIISCLKSITKDEWDAEFADDAFLSELLLKVKKKESEFFLDSNYYQSIYDFSKDIIQNDESPSEWLMENWIELVQVLSEDYLNQFKNNITVHFSEHLNLEDITFLKINADFIDKQQICSKNLPKLKTNIEDGIKTEANIEKLNSIVILLDESNTKFERGFKSVIKDTLNESWNDTANDEFKNVLEKIGGLVGVKLVPNTEE